MAFTHKLAARLARLKDSAGIVAALAVATIVVSCEHPATDPSSSIAQLVVSPQNVTLQQNQAEDFLAVGFTATGDSADIAVSWSATGGSIDSSSAGKRHYGHYTSATCGTFTVTATSHPGNVSTAVSVSVTGCPLPVASVSVTPATATIGVGQTAQYAAITRDAFGNPLGGRTVTWSSSNPAVATVNGAGQATGVAVGAATLTATSEGKSGTAALTVTNVPVASVTVSPATASVPAGQGVQLTATLKDANGNTLTGRTVTWSSDNTAVATVSGSGLVSGVVAGAATITATSEAKTGTSAITVTAPPPGSSQFGHVFVVTEENTDYVDVTTSSMPYLMGLAAQYGLATQYYANTHPSIGNYFELATGQIITNNDGYSQIVSVDNIVRELVAAGKTWKSYAEDLPSVGYTGGDVGNYARKHNVFALLSDVANDPAQTNRLVPFTQFATDLANGTLPTFSNIVPNLCNDAHDCGLDVADSWLQTNIAPLIASPVFQQDGLLIIVFDEAGGDNTNGGGRIVWVAVSPKAKRAYQSTTLYQHPSTLRLILKGLGVSVFPGAAASAPDMSEFFTP